MNIRTIWGRFLWHWLSLLLSLVGLGCLGGLMWAVQARLSTWDVQAFVGIIYGAMGSAVLSSLASRRAYQLAPAHEWDAHDPKPELDPKTELEPKPVLEPRSELESGPELEPKSELEPVLEPSSHHSESNRDYDLDTELEPLWDFSRWLRWMVWGAVMGIALWVWFPPTAELVGWWERQISMFFFR